MNHLTFSKLLYTATLLYLQNYSTIMYSTHPSNMFSLCFQKLYTKGQLNTWCLLCTQQKKPLQLTFTITPILFSLSKSMHCRVYVLIFLCLDWQHFYFWNSNFEFYILSGEVWWSPPISIWYRSNIIELNVFIYSYRDTNE